MNGGAGDALVVVRDYPLDADGYAEFRARELGKTGFYGA